MGPETATRHSNVAYVLAKLRLRGEDCLLLHAHPKWGDWSLVGGHVEPTDATWLAAAAREVEEEMAPLRYGDDVEVDPLDLPATQWGPIPSRSADLRPTSYRAEWYVLRFKTDPSELLAKLPSGEFCLVRVADLTHAANLSSVIHRAATVLPHGWDSLPLSWQANLDQLPLEQLAITHTPHTLSERSGQGAMRAVDRRAGLRELSQLTQELGGYDAELDFEADLK